MWPCRPAPTGPAPGELDSWLAIEPSVRLASKLASGLIAGLTGLLVACSGPALNSSLAEAEAALAAGDYAEALRHYDVEHRRCQGQIGRPSPACNQVGLGRAELLDRMDRKDEASAAYRALADAPGQDDEVAATALYRAGRIELALGHDEPAYRLLWRTVTDHPDKDHAVDAVRVLLRDGRRRDASQLYRVLADLLQPLASTTVADNLCYAMADLAEHELSDPAVALAFYDKIAIDYPDSGLRDDAFFHAARLARSLGDGKGAARRLRELLSTREVARIAGSYNSIWFDNAQLELGRVLRDDLGDWRTALAAFARLGRDYPASVLRDDAAWEIAVTWDGQDDGPRTCEALAALAAWPDSKYELERAPALREKRGCPPLRGKTGSPPSPASPSPSPPSR